MKRILYTVMLFCLAVSAVQAQNDKKEFKAFDHLDLGVTLGTTGIGLDVAMPFGDYVKFRTGFEVMPRFEKNLHFDVQSYGGDGSILESKFDRIAELMKGFTGYEMDDNITMVGKPKLWNFKFMVDVYPFRNKHWHLTAGFHWGPSEIAEAVNAIEDSPSLFAVGLYNNFYQKAWNEYNGISDPLFVIGEDIDYDDNGNEILVPYGPGLDPQLGDKFLQYGKMGIHVGQYTHDVTDENGTVIHQKGDPYYMQPDENSMVTARVKTNSFKPYLGFGYGGRLLKNNDKYHVSFDAGLMFWGGTPSILTNDGTNLAKDVEDIGGRVGDYVDLISGIKVYPVLNVRFTRTIF